MTSANHTPEQMLEEVAGLAVEGSMMADEREMHRRLVRIAGEIRLWQSEHKTVPWYERELPPIPTKTEAQRAYGRFGDTWWARLLSGGASATGAELRFRRKP